MFLNHLTPTTDNRPAVVHVQPIVRNISVDVSTETEPRGASPQVWLNGCGWVSITWFERCEMAVEYLREFFDGRRLIAPAQQKRNRPELFRVYCHPQDVATS